MCTIKTPRFVVYVAPCEAVGVCVCVCASSPSALLPSTRTMCHCMPPTTNCMSCRILFQSNANAFHDELLLLACVVVVVVVTFPFCYHHDRHRIHVCLFYLEFVRIYKLEIINSYNVHIHMRCGMVWHQHVCVGVLWAAHTIFVHRSKDMSDTINRQLCSIPPSNTKPNVYPPCLRRWFEQRVEQRETKNYDAVVTSLMQKCNYHRTMFLMKFAPAGMK